MIELGKIQKMVIVRRSKIGVYLNSKNDEIMEEILLPKNQVSNEMQLDDEIDVFVYKDSEDRLIATIKTPKITLGEIAMLRVVDITGIGAFLDWGLEKDLFLPFKEQLGKIREGDYYIVGLYIDKSERLCATMKISRLLEDQSPYKENDRVKGIIYSINKELGAFVAVDNKYHGLISSSEFLGACDYGDNVDVRVKQVKPDGKLELSFRKEAHNEIDDDSDKIYKKLRYRGGSINLNDKSSPNAIKLEFNMSKSAFKRAIGRLYKEQKINITEKGIELK
ncbi:S1 RNA-binding domain-containing protein [Alkalibaculum sp. M08DMB]|uniref:S1 RNA-binding domain-containing protein n=1 Tax=Alkalibaculum sporogenes TaxID=2655001 RepID=A0A6A7KCN5_9FIRM|nr:S1-like domain-containing RNA-binding protein [Alkalibaculum sporogenes]MPW27204.1 S1 RNA-binding domain-containing protein [Alkalibaculum sporogenes]